MLKFEHVSFAYPNEEKIIEDVSFAVEPGEFISIIGPSGCGKSTIFRLLTGLEKVQSGKIEMSQAGYMPQQDLLLPWRTIVDNAAIALECQGMKKKEAREKIMTYLEIFGLQGYENKYPKDLSGGMRQRVSFLRTFATGADIMLLDEPFSALDAITKMTLQEWLYEQWKKWRKTILFITHDVEEALFLSNRIFVITEKPIQQIKEYRVPLDQNRTRKDLNTPEIVEMKANLIEMLKKKVIL